MSPAIGPILTYDSETVAGLLIPVLPLPHRPGSSQILQEAHVAPKLDIV